MINLLKYTYLLDTEKIQKELDSLWKKYSDILKKPNWDDLNEARSILYLTGNFYCEKIAPEAIERRLHLLKKEISLIDFLTLVDSKSERLSELRKDPMFAKLETFYLIVKNFKNNFVGGDYYLNEEKFIKLYNKHNPDKSIGIGYRGGFLDKYTESFEKLSIRDVGIAGGKGASLGEMTQAGIPIPPGFVVLSDAFDDFMKKTSIDLAVTDILSKINFENSTEVEEASRKIRTLILGEKFPEGLEKIVRTDYEKLNSKYVAIRSSATAEDGAENVWAGQLETYLNTKEENLLENIKKCWASLFTPRAIFYRFEKGLQDKKISVAVLVQTMIQSEVSGVAFTVHPVTQDRAQMIIEAGHGLGEAIVGGMVTPDSYVVNKNDFSITDKYISKQERKIVKDENGGIGWEEVEAENQECQKMSDKKILELGKLCKRIENHYGKPQDIEWAFEGGNLYITQSRPITTLSICVSNGPQYILGNQDVDTSMITVGMTWCGIEHPDIEKQIGLKLPKIFCNIIKGQVAQPGVVEGKVKLLFGPQHNNKIEEGDILVATATSPQFLPAMKRAAAFITDIGGITSHAAIVARELKKPCIVGTRVATQILRDGMEVEIDADEGLIKILNK